MAAVELYGVPRTTLYYRLAGSRQSRQDAHEDQQRLTKPEEKAIVKFCFEMDDCGFPPRLDYVKDMALHLHEKRIGYKPLPIGKNWITRFLSRHPDLASKYSTKLDRQRAHANDPRIIKDYFAKLTSLIRRYGLKAFQIFNMDEKGFLMGVASRAKVLCRRGRRNPRVTHDGNRELVTVVETVGALGCALSPLIINKGKGQYMGCFQNLTEKERGYQFGYSPKGWTDNRLAMLWLETVFEPETASITAGLPRLLILDGHGSHITYEFARYCDEHDILLLCLPSHSTHLLQPLDVGLFSPYQHFYGQAVDDYMRSGQNTYGVKKAIFIPFLTEAREQTFIPKNILQSFSTIGIWPLCARKVLTKMAPETKSRRDTLGIIASPRTSRDIRRRIMTAEKLLDKGMANLNLGDSPSEPSRYLLGRIKVIMRDLGHQLETEIAHSDLYVEQSRKLQGLAHVYNQTDRRILSKARILSGAVLMELRDKRLAMDAKKEEDKAAWVLKIASRKDLEIVGKSLPKTTRRAKVFPLNPPLLVPTDGEDEMGGGNTSDDSWADIPILGNDGFFPVPIPGEERVRKLPDQPKSPLFSGGRLLPDRPLHMALRSHRPATKFLSGNTPLLLSS